MLSTRKEKIQITCLGILYSPIIMTSLEGDACPDTTHFLMAGTQVSCHLGEEGRGWVEVMNIGRLHKLVEFIISNLRVTIMLNLFALFGGEVA